MSSVFIMSKKNPKAKTVLLQIGVKYKDDQSESWKRVVKSLGYSVPFEYWNDSRKKVKPGYVKADEINALIGTKIAMIEESLLDAKLKKKAFTKTLIESIINGNSDNPDKQIKVQTVTDHFEKYIAHLEAKRRAVVYVNKNRTILKRLKEFVENHDQYSLADFRLFDLPEFYNDYLNYWWSKSYQINTVGNFVRYLKYFLNYCSDELEVYSGRQYRKWKIPEWRGSEIVTVTIDELTWLLNYEFKSSKHERARDLFAFQCYTGLRYSDIKKLRSEHINWEDQTITLRQQKTKELINKVPLHPNAFAILEKYKSEYQVLPIISNQKYNDYLKEAAKKAKLDRMVIINTTEGGKYKESTRPLYDLLSTHKGRSSFISNMKDKGVDSDEIRQFTGHTDRTNRALNRYDRKSDTRLSSAINKLF